MGKQIKQLEEAPNADKDPEIAIKIRALADQIPQQAADGDMSQCPHCTRTFSSKAAERHIEKCASIQNKPRPPPTKA